MSVPNYCACNSAAARGIEIAPAAAASAPAEVERLASLKGTPRARSQGRPGIRAPSLNDFIDANDVDNPIWEISRFWRAPALLPNSR